MMLTDVDGSVDGSEREASTPKTASDLRVCEMLTDVDGKSDYYVGPRTHTRTQGHIENHRQHRQPSTPRIRGGRAVVAGVEHVMRMAKPSSVTARLYGLNPNSQVRVWCECQDARRRVRVAGGIDAIVAKVDQRDLEWDWLGIADMRVPGSALDLFRSHIEEVARHDANL